MDNFPSPQALVHVTSVTQDFNVANLLKLYVQLEHTLLWVILHVNLVLQDTSMCILSIFLPALWIFKIWGSYVIIRIFIPFPTSSPMNI